MRLDEIRKGITVDGVPSKTHKLIKDTFYELKQDGLGIIELFEPFYKNVKIRQVDGQENLINVIFKTPNPRAAGSMRFAGTGKGQDELDHEHLQAKAAGIADEMLHWLGRKIKIEDYNIEKRNDSVVLFMVSDGFINADESIEEAKPKKKLKVNYDSWSTKPPKNMNEYHVAVLRLMDDGKARERSVMIRQATDLDPNPVSRNGFAGWNKIDYDLYKMGYLKVVDILPGGKKVFKITPAGKRAWPKSEWADPKWDY